MRIVGTVVVCLGILFGAYWSMTPHPPEASVAAAAKPAPPQPDDARAAKCSKALQQLSRTTGAWRSYQMDQNGIGVVEVGDAYYASSFDDKALLNQGMLCIFTRGRETAAADVGVAGVQYEDYRSHKLVATWSPFSGLDVK